ncbi:predicted protein [Histoplasma capsulatum G186AR]|uniref:Uncharacterized protein n=2 Tax=Ajellomyces capsulatus TaxID=5037 RepID=C0NAQ3_AJECG|nr:uncharacterized protein HCBG_00199 [Histoplasma capsulatum G186AR]EEH10744.1 predicted protein [Histoplasma capsulatum G186AR]KAG5288630.1 DUF2406 superfamily domain-containing protein [Histoplasma capsulatum]QSS71205.1 DUF2406 superfamily domain-containing protein [Histoplasma capsulatum G186AR]
MAVQSHDSPKRSRVLSLTSSSGKSEKSRKSSGSQHKIKLTETHEEKEAYRPRTYADPTRAIQELQPAAVALQKSNLESLRAIQHKDIYGNPITDPDLSNPTRHRFERPLDTIRSFEAAIDGSYLNRRVSYIRGDESANGGYSRRSSYFGDRGGGYGNHRIGGYNEQANYSNHRLAPSRPDSFAESYGGGNYNGYNNGYNNNNSNNNSNNGYQPRTPRHGGRMNPDQHMQGYNNINNSYQSQQQSQYPPGDNYNYPSPSGAGADAYADPNNTGDDNNNPPYRQQPQQPPPQPPPHQQNQPQSPRHQTLAETYGFNGFGDAPDLDSPQSPHGANSRGRTNNDGYYRDPHNNNNSSADYGNNSGSNNNNNNYFNNNQASAAPPSVPAKDIARKPVAAFSLSPSDSPSSTANTGAIAGSPTAAAAASSSGKRMSFFRRFNKS